MLRPLAVLCGLACAAAAAAAAGDPAAAGSGELASGSGHVAGMLNSTVTLLRAKNPSLRCVFIHGVGVSKTNHSSHLDSDSYWGGTDNIALFTPYCHKRYFLHQDTITRGWDNEDMQQAACDTAVRPRDSATGLIRDTVIISHSMGNLIMAEAIRQGRCHFHSSSRWISIEAPWGGSPAAKWVENICEGNMSAATRGPLKWLAKELGYCDPTKPNSVARGYQVLAPDFPGLERLKPLAEKYVSYSICGKSPYGITSAYSVGLEVLGELVNYGEPCDGMVGRSSCQLAGRNYEPDYRTSHYIADVNHADGTCRSGNGGFGFESRKPCDWLGHVLEKEHLVRVGGSRHHHRGGGGERVVQELPQPQHRAAETETETLLV